MIRLVFNFKKNIYLVKSEIFLGEKSKTKLTKNYCFYIFYHRNNIWQWHSVRKQNFRIDNFVCKTSHISVELLKNEPNYCKFWKVVIFNDRTIWFSLIKDLKFCVLKNCNNIARMSNLSWLVWENECGSEEAFQPSFNKMLIFPPPWSCLGRIKKKKKICLIILNKFRGKFKHIFSRDLHFLYWFTEIPAALKSVHQFPRLSRLWRVTGTWTLVSPN